MEGDGSGKLGPALAHAQRAGDYFSLYFCLWGWRGGDCVLPGLPRSPAISLEPAAFLAKAILVSKKEKACLSASL